MTPTLSYLLYYTLITWALLMVASMVRVKGWTPSGLMLAMGNRESLPPHTPFSGRAERTAHNTKENLLLFAALALLAHAAGKSGAQVDQGAEIFFWARIVYIPVYLLGIAYVRTVVYGISLWGLGLIVLATLQ